jgi:hypothetical protein
MENYQRLVGISHPDSRRQSLLDLAAMGFDVAESFRTAAEPARKLGKKWTGAGRNPCENPAGPYRRPCLLEDGRRQSQFIRWQSVGE